MTSRVNTAVSFINWTEHLDYYIKRMKGVYIECLDFREVIKKYDRKNTVFFLDPPYVHHSRSSSHRYGYELTNFDHFQMLEIINRIKGNAVISGYDNKVYEHLTWRRVEKDQQKNSGKGSEVLWIKD